MIMLNVVFFGLTTAHLCRLKRESALAFKNYASNEQHTRQRYKNSIARNSHLSGIKRLIKESRLKGSCLSEFVYLDGNVMDNGSDIVRNRRIKLSMDHDGYSQHFNGRIYFHNFCLQSKSVEVAQEKVSSIDMVRIVLSSLFL